MGLGRGGDTFEEKEKPKLISSSNTAGTSALYGQRLEVMLPGPAGR